MLQSALQPQIETATHWFRSQAPRALVAEALYTAQVECH